MSGFQAVDKSKLGGKVRSETPIQKSLAALLVQDQEIRSGTDIEEKSKAPQYKVKRLSDIISSNVRSSNDLRTITHHIKRAEQIWKTLLLKPNGDQPNLLDYDTKPSDIKSSVLHDSLLQVVKNYFTTKYPIENEIPQMIGDVLFRKGAYVVLNIPHCVLDHLINGYEVTGHESFVKDIKPRLHEFKNREFVDDFTKAKNIGIVRDAPVDNITTVDGFESLYTDARNGGTEFELVKGSDGTGLGWTFTDNVNVFSYYRAAKVIKERSIETRSGLESFGNLIRRTITEKETSKAKSKNLNSNNIGVLSRSDFNSEMSKIYPHRQWRHSETLSVRESRFYSGRGKGTSVRYTPPMEATIPVNLPGRGGEPFGYIFLTDPKTGEFLCTASDLSMYMGTKNENTDSGASSLDEVIRHLKDTNELGRSEVDLTWMIDVAISNLERSFIESFVNGDSGKTVSLTLTDENKKIFLSRALKGQGVRSIFVPASYVTYCAVDYNDMGIGRSLVEEAKLHITRLAVLETADILANVENAISHTDLTIGLEKGSFDPRQVVEMIRNEYYANNPTLHNMLGFTNISIDTVLDKFREQSLTVKVTGGDNQAIVSPEIDVRQSDREPIKTVDSQTRDNLLNTIAGYFCLKRSWLDDNSDGNEFAVEAVADQELLRNQATEWSRIFSGFISDIIRKHIIYNEPIINDLVEKILEAEERALKPDQGTEITDEEGKTLNKEEKVELILADFINSLYVQLPTILVSETLDKVSTKVKAIHELADDWWSMCSGSKLIEKYCSELELDVETLKNVLQAVFLRHAYAKYNLPVPFEEFVEDGNKGGVIANLNMATNLQNNVISFISEWYESNKKVDKSTDKLKNKIQKDKDKQAEKENTLDNEEGGFGGDNLGGDPNVEPGEGETPAGDDALPETPRLSWDSEMEEPKGDEEPEGEPLDDNTPPDEETPPEGDAEVEPASEETPPEEEPQVEDEENPEEEPESEKKKDDSEPGFTW